MKKDKRPLKPFKAAIWNLSLRRWEGKLPIKPYVAFDHYAPRRPKKKPAKKIPTKSATQKKEDALYAVLKKEWAKTHRYCVPCRQAGRITKAEPYPHHIRGRDKLQNDPRFWLPICEPCHRKIENDRAWARSMGYLASRDSKTIALQCGNK